jgi:hypothetical protein
MQVTVVCPWFRPGPLQYLERRLHWLHRSVGQRTSPVQAIVNRRGWILAWLCMCHSERHKEVQFCCKKQVYVFVLRSSTVHVACLNPLSILLLAPATPCDKLAVIPIYEKQQEQEEPHERNWTGYLFGYFISPFFWIIIDKKPQNSYLCLSIRQFRHLRKQVQPDHGDVFLICMCYLAWLDMQFDCICICIFMHLTTFMFLMSAADNKNSTHTCLVTSSWYWLVLVFLLARWYRPPAG